MIVDGEPGQIRIIDDQMTDNSNYIFYCIEIKPGKGDMEFVSYYFWDHIEDYLQGVRQTFFAHGFKERSHYPPRFHNSVPPKTWALCPDHRHFIYATDTEDHEGEIKWSDVLAVLEDLNNQDERYFRPEFFQEIKTWQI